ncbi:MAG TPA: lamin tail domain-containing protein [Methanothrix sp.]|nr:lamin tail domain-containing protein [Methanothrix sp.]HRW83310.1 lamin tail domain-containing protein [Methanothrix sp.]
MISSGSGTIFINEVELNPAGDDSSQEVLEWVELYNSGNEDVDISGWTLITSHGDKEIVRIPSGSTIEAKGFYAIPDRPPKEQWLDNLDESVTLKNSSGVEVDKTPTLSDDLDDNCAWSRYPDSSPNWEFMISSKGFNASGDFCYSSRDDDDALSCCFGEYDDGSLWNVSCMNIGDQPSICQITDPFYESEECETSVEDECPAGQEETNETYYLKFNMNQAISGAGFVNVNNGYATPAGDVISTELYTREHGSGSYESEEVTRLIRENRFIKFYNVSIKAGNASIEMDKDVSARYTTTMLGLPRNRSVTYSSTWTEESWSKSKMTTPVVGSKESCEKVYHRPWCYHVDQIIPENLIWFSSPADAYANGYRACLDCIQNNVSYTTMSESYRYATSIDRESHIVRDQNRSTMIVESEFDGIGHIGVLKLSDPGASVHGVPVIEAREDYIGSFKILDRIDEENSSLTFNKSTSGTGFAATSKRIREGQKTYESGTGVYNSEELIDTETNYIAKDLNVIHSPMNQTLTEEVSINSSLRWKEGVWSRIRNTDFIGEEYTSFIGEEYTSADRLKKETEVRGLNEMETKANFSGKARYRTILRDEVDQDEEYEGDYSIRRMIIFTGIPKYDQPHINVTKTGDIDLLNCSERASTVLYTITLENDGNRALGPIYVKDIFPPGAAFIEPSSLRPTELTAGSANWTLTHLAIGDSTSIDICLDVVNCPDGELTNQAVASGGYNGNWITGSSTYTIQKKCGDHIVK